MRQLYYRGAGQRWRGTARAGSQFMRCGKRSQRKRAAAGTAAEARKSSLLRHGGVLGPTGAVAPVAERPVRRLASTSKGLTSAPSSTMRRDPVSKVSTETAGARSTQSAIVVATVQDAWEVLSCGGFTRGRTHRMSGPPQSGSFARSGGLQAETRHAGACWTFCAFHRVSRRSLRVSFLGDAP